MGRQQWKSSGTLVSKCFVIVGVLRLEIKDSYRPAASLGTLECRMLSSQCLILLSGQLLVQFGDVVVPLGLVAGSSHRGSQAVFLPEALDLESSAFVSGSVGEDGLGAGQTAWLLVRQPHIPVQTCGRQTEFYCSTTQLMKNGAKQDVTQTERFHIKNTKQTHLIFHFDQNDVCQIDSSHLHLCIRNQDPTRVPSWAGSKLHCLIRFGSGSV